MSTSNSRRRRVTFQEGRTGRRCVGLTQGIGRHSPLQHPGESPPAPILKKNRQGGVLPPTSTPIALHGRMLVGSRQPDDGITHRRYDHHLYAFEYDEEEYDDVAPLGGIRESMQRRSTFSRLSSQVEQFQKIVGTLDELAHGGEDVAAKTAAWRVRNLVTTAQSMDKTLWEELYSFEKTLMDNEGCLNVTELRKEQTACMKLHRDFKRTHRRLVMCMSVLKDGQWSVDHYEVSSQLGSVGWLSLKSEDDRSSQFHRQHAAPQHSHLHEQDQPRDEEEQVLGDPVRYEEQRDQFENYGYVEEHASHDDHGQPPAPRMIITRKMAQRQEQQRLLHHQSAMTEDQLPMHHAQPPLADGYMEPVFHDPPEFAGDQEEYVASHFQHQGQFHYDDADQQPEPSIFTGLSTLSSPSGIHQRMQNLLYEQFDDFVRPTEEEEDAESEDSVASPDNYSRRRNRDKWFEDSVLYQWTKKLTSIVWCPLVDSSDDGVSLQPSSASRRRRRSRPRVA